MFKRAKALRDDAYEAETVAKHALQALMDEKERKRVDELLRSVTRRGNELELDAVAAMASMASS